MTTPTAPTRPPALHIGRDEPYNFECLDELFDAEYAPSPCRAILMGCGSGRTAVYLAKGSHRVLGIDPNRNLLAAARERAVLAGVEMDLMAGDPVNLPPMPEEAFGLAVDFWTACTLVDGVPRETYLRTIYKLLMRNGVLLASAPAPKGKRRSHKRTFAFAGPFVSDFTRAGFEVLFERIRSAPTGEPRLLVHARKPG